MKPKIWKCHESGLKSKEMPGIGKDMKISGFSKMSRFFLTRWNVYTYSIILDHVHSSLHHYILHVWRFSFSFSLIFILSFSTSLLLSYSFAFFFIETLFICLSGKLVHVEVFQSISNVLTFPLVRIFHV